MAEIIIIDPLGGPSSTVRCGLENTARGNSSTISGGDNNTASGNNSTIAGGFSNTASNCCSTIAGGSLNFANAEYSFIGSGRLNTTDDSYSIVVGGENNFAGCECTFVGGGQFNSATSFFSTVVGGNYNLSCTQFGVIVGGYNNSVIGACSSILGGDNNTTFSDSTVIGGGSCNQSYSTYGTIGGGYGNQVYLDGATIAGGQNNTAIQYNSAIGGGYGNTVDGACSFAVGNSNIVSGNTSFVLSSSSVLNASNSAILGGSFIFGSCDNTVYVPQLNISSVGGNPSVSNLGIDSDGFVVVGTDITGSTPSLSEVLNKGNETSGYDIVISNTDNIINENATGLITVRDSGTGSRVDLLASEPISNVESSIGVKPDQINLVSINNTTLDQGSIGISVPRVQLLTPKDGLNSVFINNFNYGFNTLTTTGGTPEIIYTLPITAFPTKVSQINVYCSGVDVTTNSGITQELVTSVISNFISITEITTGATTTFKASNFPSAVEVTLVVQPTEILVRVIGEASTTIDWSCKIRWSV